MKALTLHAPWAWAICFLGKRVENRTWAPPSGMIGKRFAIHAGSAKLWTLAELIPVLNLWHTIHRGEQYDQRFPPAEDFCSAIVATARLVGVGSVCTRPLHGSEGLLPVLEALDRELPRYVQLHLFGVKGEALRYRHLFGDRIASIDSMAWDAAARRDKSAAYTVAHRAAHMVRWYLAQQRQSPVSALQIGMFEAHSVQRGW